MFRGLHPQTVHRSVGFEFPARVAGEFARARGLEVEERVTDDCIARVGLNFTALVSRQYVQMTRVRVEGLLAAFPKLVGSGKQHTYVETENVRYVYQPLECGTMYLLLVTTKGSNILEDLDVLRLLAKTLPEYTRGQGMKKAFLWRRLI